MGYPCQERTGVAPIPGTGARTGMPEEMAGATSLPGEEGDGWAPRALTRRYGARARALAPEPFWVASGNWPLVAGEWDQGPRLDTVCALICFFDRGSPRYTAESRWNRTCGIAL